MKLYYYPAFGRASHTLLILNWTEQKYEFITPEWPGTLKAETPFGQMPYLTDGDLKIAQSNAIARYVARKVNLQGDNDKDFAMSEMLIEEANDIYGLLVKCHYQKEGRDAAWQKAIKEDLPAHFANLEKLLNGAQFCSKVLSGDLAIYSIIHTIRVSIDPKAASQFPKLNAFVDMIAAQPGAKRYHAITLRPYFTLEAPKH